MKRKISGVQALLSFVAFLFVMGPVANFVQLHFGVSPLVTLGFAVAVLALSGLMSRVSGKLRDHNVHTASVDVEKWVDYIIERLWKDNMFLEKAWSDDQYVVNNSLVHIPQPGAAATVNKNNAGYPVAAVQRADTDVTYALDAYTTVPTLIPDVDLEQISYDKVASIVNDHFGYLIEGMADDMIFKWANGLNGALTTAGGNVINTLGGASVSTVAGQTGNRLVLTYRELQLAQKALNKQKVMKTGRYALLSSEMVDQLINSLNNTQYKDFSRAFDPAKGTIGEFAGFGIIERATVGTVQAALSAGNLVANDFQTAAGATDNEFAFCYQENAVSRAIGERKLFQRIGDPLYYGDIYSALVRAGGRRRRADNAGVVAIVQTAA